MQYCRTLILAGHDTTSHSLVWIFYELAKNREFQSRIRDEIRSTRTKVTERGDANFSIADLESLTLLQAAIKVSYRPSRSLAAFVNLRRRKECVYIRSFGYY